jgi:hypothetical protein
MTDEEFRKAIVEALYAGPPFWTRDILVRYKDGGGAQAQAYEILMGILTEFREAGVPEEIDDALLDTMEGVVGDVSPKSRVWPNRLET